MGSRKERDEKLRKNIERMTSRHLTSVFKRLNLSRYSEKITDWAYIHKKATFAITICFLLMVVVITMTDNYPFVDRENKVASDGLQETYKAFLQTKDSISSSRKSPGVSEIFALMKFKEELNMIKAKRELTKEDSLRIKELYDKLKSSYNEAN